MRQQIVVAGADTGVEQGVSSAGLASLLGANYWKPILARMEEETDSECVVRRAAILRSDYSGALPTSHVPITSSLRRNRRGAHQCRLA